MREGSGSLGDTLKPYIRAYPDFPKRGIVFRDISPLLKDTGAMGLALGAFEMRWRGYIDGIAALDARGFLFGAPLADRLQVPFAMVRKRGKLPGDIVAASYSLEYGDAAIEMQDDAFVIGSRVLIVDDLLATGGTARAAAELVVKIGSKVAGYAFVIELKDLGGREKLAEPAGKIHVLTTY